MLMIRDFSYTFIWFWSPEPQNHIHVSLLRSGKKVPHILGNEPGTIPWQWSGGQDQELEFCYLYALP